LNKKEAVAEQDVQVAKKESEKLRAELSTIKQTSQVQAQKIAAEEAELKSLKYSS